MSEVPLDNNENTKVNSNSTEPRKDIENNGNQSTVPVPVTAPRLLNVAKGEATPEMIELVRKKIRESVSEVRMGEIRKAPVETIEEHIAYMQMLIEEFHYISGEHFEYTLEELCIDFITEFYNILNTYRTIDKLENYYSDAGLTLPGAKSSINGINRVISVWMVSSHGAL